MSLQKAVDALDPYLGLKEGPGPTNNQRIIQMAHDAGFTDYTQDSVPWCVVPVAYAMRKAGYSTDGLTLWALDAKKWGREIAKPIPGCVVVFKRFSGGKHVGGHVGLWLSENSKQFFLRHGNVSDALKDSAVSKSSRVLRFEGYFVPKEYEDDEAVFNDVGGGPVTVPFPKDDRLFDAAMELVFQSEGGYVNHPNDPGGPTNMGITFDTAKRHGYRTITALKNMTREQAKEIYRVDYWEPIQAGRMPPGISYAVFDFTLHSGQWRAVTTLQEVLGGIAVDGEVGPETLGAVHAADSARLLDRLLDRRMAFLKRLPTWRSFGRGWTNRLNKVRREATAMLGPVQGEILPPITALPEGLTPEGKALAEYQVMLLAQYFDIKPKREITMELEPHGKPAIKSRGVQGGLIALIATVLPVIGPMIGLPITEDMTYQIVAALGALWAIYGRIVAETKVDGIFKPGK
jgi:uncharacterized protein (TIGR02594 family)